MPKKYLTKQERLEIALPETVKLQASLFLRRDPMTGKIAHGEWTRYITRLVVEDLNRKANTENKHVAD